MDFDDDDVALRFPIVQNNDAPYAPKKAKNPEPRTHEHHGISKINWNPVKEPGIPDQHEGDRRSKNKEKIQISVKKWYWNE